MMYKPFSPARFEKLVDEFLKKEQSILGHKGTEYADYTILDELPIPFHRETYEGARAYLNRMVAGNTKKGA